MDGWRNNMNRPRGDITIRLLQPEDAGAMLSLCRASRAVFEKFQPAKADEYYTLAVQQEDIAKSLAEMNAGNEFSFGIFHGDTELVGRIRLSAVHRGLWQNANLGYFVGTAYQGQGFATEAVKLTAALAFGEIGLHRLQAAVMPWNPASLRVMEKTGFRREGLAERYLKINGTWNDHVLFAQTAEDLISDGTE
ncbi:MAG: GNAT family N-acetyltransferase [Gorillibacterium sp.]|nr:GNAT family N-acetyltransferase [Gorillibacterium sp.]